MKKILLFLFTILGLALQLQAQNSIDPNESIGILRQNGQIYLVVLVLVTIFAGIIFMLIRIERKLNKLESKKH